MDAPLSRIRQLLLLVRSTARLLAYAMLYAYLAIEVAKALADEVFLINNPFSPF